MVPKSIRPLLPRSRPRTRSAPLPLPHPPRSPLPHRSRSRSRNRSPPHPARRATISPCSPRLTGERRPLDKPLSASHACTSSLSRPLPPRCRAERRTEGQRVVVPLHAGGAAIRRMKRRAAPSLGQRAPQTKRLGIHARSNASSSASDSPVCSRTRIRLRAGGAHVLAREGERWSPRIQYRPAQRRHVRPFESRARHADADVEERRAGQREAARRDRPASGDHARELTRKPRGCLSGACRAPPRARPAPRPTPQRTAWCCSASPCGSREQRGDSSDALAVERSCRPTTRGPRRRAAPCPPRANCVDVRASSAAPIAARARPACGDARRLRGELRLSW